MTALAVRGLSHTYADGRAALRGLTFDVQAGESVGLVGPNGAGKTTLFLRLAGVLAGPAGQVAVAGLDPAIPAERKQLPRQVGIVFQNPDDQLFSPTLFDDVAFGPLNFGLPPSEVRARVSEALAAVGLKGFEERSPHRLSGGEKRRAALATVLAMRPGVLLFDEPTMFLDPRGRRELATTIRGLPGTKLIATHDLDFVLDVCSRVIVIDGELLDDGDAKMILADDALLTPHGLEVPYRLKSRETS